MKITIILLTSLFALFCQSCNTVNGLGQDMQQAGNILTSPFN